MREAWQEHRSCHAAMTFPPSCVLVNKLTGY